MDKTSLFRFYEDNRTEKISTASNINRMNKYPVFKKSEIVVELPKVEGLGTETEIVAKILYKGQNAHNYEVGQTILFNKKVGSEIKYFGKPLWKIDHQDHILCEIKEAE